MLDVRCGTLPCRLVFVYGVSQDLGQLMILSITLAFARP